MLTHARSFPDELHISNEIHFRRKFKSGLYMAYKSVTIKPPRREMKIELESSLLTVESRYGVSANADMSIGSLPFHHKCLSKTHSIGYSGDDI
jgi:hypothetical protein